MTHARVKDLRTGSTAATVDRFHWDACPGETLRATVHVANTGSIARDYNFGVTGLEPAKVEVSPSSAALAPGASVAVGVTVYPADGVKPGETLRGELLIRGAYEQCVCLSLRVAATEVPQVCVAQGDPPQRVTELAWHRHYQCIEPCGPTRGPNDPPPGRATAGAQG